MPSPSTSRRLILCADDYGLSAGVSRGILELVADRRLSAVSAMVTFPRWVQDAPALAAVRDRVAVGLHLNLTLGAPTGPMPGLASDGRLPAIGRLTRAAVCGRIDASEVEAEATRQIDRFTDVIGHPPDHIDGHQHAHALPGVRGGVLAAVTQRQAPGGPVPLLRDPSDDLAAILRRGVNPVKAITVGALSAGFRQAARRRGLPVNRGFSGFSAFDAGRDYAGELEAVMRAPGPLHITMCHPGHADAELAALDPVTARREQELAAIRAMPGLPDRIWRPERAADGPAMDWWPLAAPARRGDGG